jgi:hypothetical protein
MGDFPPFLITAYLVEKSLPILLPENILRDKKTLLL